MSRSIRFLALAALLALTTQVASVGAAQPIPQATGAELTRGSQRLGKAQPPIAVPDAYHVRSGNTLSVPASVGVLNNDVDPERGALNVVAFDGTGTLGSAQLFSDGRFDYTPSNEGPDFFRYRIQDADLNVSEWVSVRIDVLPSIDTKPVGQADVYSTAHGAALSIATPGLLINDIDRDGGSIVVSQYSSGTVQGDVTVFSDGRLNYTPPEGFEGTESFTYRVWDQQNEISDPIPVTIEVFPDENRAPVGIADFYSVRNDEILSVVAPGLLGNDTDADGDALLVSQYSSGALMGSVSVFSDGRLSYTPPADFQGTDTFTYRIVDPDIVISSPITVTIQVVEPNHAPLAVEDHYYTRSRQRLSVPASNGLLVNDEDADGDGLTVSGNTDSADGVLSVRPDGSVIFDPDPVFIGQTTFTYDVSDGEERSTAVVHIIVGN